MRVSLRWKLVSGFGLLLVLLALLGWVTFTLFSSLRGVQRRVFDDAIPGLVAVDEMVRSYTAQSGAVRGFLIGSQIPLLEQYRAEVEVAAFWQRRAASLFDSPEERELLEELSSAGDSFQDLVDERVIPRAQEGNRVQAFRVLSQEGTPLIAQIEALGGELAAVQDRVVAATENELRLRANQTLVTLTLVTVGALLIGIVVAIVLPRRLSNNLSRLVAATRAIGRGDFNQSVEIHSGDELEELGERFGEMQAGLKRLQQLALQDRELEIAASIQRNLLQRSLPEIEGVRIFPLQRQANLVGGDWYDVEDSGGLVTVAVGDASGKGIAAALMATVALSVLRAERGLGAGPKRIIERTNQALRDATDPESFTTCIYASIDAASGEVTWLNMGHTAPFVLRPPTASTSARGFYVEGSRNRVLGWWEDPGTADNAVVLQPGDRLVFYTDGFLEAKSEQGEIFGEHRMADALLALAPLDPEMLAQELVADVERFAAGKLDDDLTMLVIEFRGQPLTSGPAGRRTGEDQWHSRR